MKDLTQEFLKLHVIAMAVEILDKVRQQLARACGMPCLDDRPAKHSVRQCRLHQRNALHTAPGTCMTMLTGPCLSISG